jgi:hypothetical protein
MAPMRRFTPPAASRAIGNYRCEFAISGARANRKNPFKNKRQNRAAKPNTEPSVN